MSSKTGPISEFSKATEHNKKKIKHFHLQSVLCSHFELFLSSAVILYMQNKDMLVFIVV